MQVAEMARVMGGAAVLERPIRSLAELRAAIGAGLSLPALERVAGHVYDDPAERRALMRAVVPEGSLKRRQRSGHLSPAESERTARLAHIVALADHVWRDRDDARAFLTTPHPELGDIAPIEAAVEEFGARQVEEILEGLLHGLPA
jgi:putative toxin-antitoxin system antitoxin component (TIGR02293 family)